MGDPKLYRPLVSCGLLTVPILGWNLVFARWLPPALGSAEFWRDIPPPLAWGENGLRLVIMVLPFLMPLEFTTAAGRRGLILFSAGALVYFASWVPLMVAPESDWSTSRLGFLAPTYTPLVWLTGLGIMGRKLYWASPYRWWIYLGLAGGFVAFHVAHGGIVYDRNY
jgi:hypothetical protein